MMVTKVLQVSLLLLVVTVGTATAKEWRGIIPLKTNRADVERLLGKPTLSSPSAVYYSLHNEIAVIHFQYGSCDDSMGKFGFGWKVATDVVTIIGVVPKVKAGKDAFGVDEKFKVEKAEAGFEYFSSTDGIEVETFDGNVTLVTYSPRANEEAGRKCPMVEKCCWDIFPTMDEFGRLPRNDELGRVDQFLAQIYAGMQRGAVVISGPNPLVRKKLTQRIDSATKRVARSRKVEPERIVFVDGGYHPEERVKLNMYAIGSEVNRIYLFPDPDPTPKAKR